MNKSSWMVGVLALVLSLSSAQAAGKPRPEPEIDCALLERTIRPGDIVFIHVDNLVFRNLENLQDSWATHVGIVVEDFYGNPVVAESRVPKSVTGSICDYVKRSKEYKFSIRRPLKPLTPTQSVLLSLESERRMDIWYDIGFDYDSKDTQYCSKFVYQVMEAATGSRAGKLQTFEELKDIAAEQGKDVNALMKFWKTYFGGKIPWKRVTITPASQYRDPNYFTLLENR